MRLPRLTSPYFVQLVLLLSGCSLINVAYNHADTVAYWYFDDYFEFNRGQRALFDQGLQRIHAWHRKAELPKYAALSSATALRVEAGFKQADLDWLENALRDRYNELANRSASDLAVVFATIEPLQLSVLDNTLAKSNAKYVKEHLSGTEEERDKKRFKDALSRIEDWVGALNSARETNMLAMLKAMPRMGEQRYAHRLARQKTLREILVGKPEKNMLESALRDWMVNWQSGRTEEHERLWRSWEEQNRQLILRLSATLTPQQRSYLAGVSNELWLASFVNA